MSLDVFNDVAQSPVEAETAQQEITFAPVLPDAPDHILMQLAGRDRVHVYGAQTIDDLRKYRLGFEEDDKTCYAILQGDRVLAAIYTAKRFAPITKPKALQGNVQDILLTRPFRIFNPPASCIFYSISNVSEQRNVAPILVRRLHAHLTAKYPSMVLSTLSPMRDFDQYVQDKGWKNFLFVNALQQKHCVFDYLLKGTDPVQRFHMKNGATIGHIKPAADTVGTTRFMVNYLYDRDPDVLKENAMRFRAGDIASLVHQDLWREAGLSKKERGFSVSNTPAAILG
jgi:hypothetical protein